MLVYRVCKKEEIDNILSDKSFINVGNNFNYSCINNHSYNKEKKYLHFFLNLDSILYLRTLKDRYLCIYDIEDNILNKNKGLGYYLNYISYNTLDEVIEYRLENKDINFDNLKQVYYINNYIDYEDLLYNFDILRFTDIIYNTEERILSEKPMLIKKVK